MCSVLISLYHISPRYSMTTIIDGLKDNMGKCTAGEGELNTRLLCVAEGGNWKYVMDISGNHLHLLFINWSIFVE